MADSPRLQLGNSLRCDEMSKRTSRHMEMTQDGPPYRQLKAWIEARDLAEATYRVCARRAGLIDRGLADQIRRAAISIPSNIAEGNGRGSNRDSLRFLYIARGSLCELETQVEVCLRLDIIPAEDAHSLNNRMALVGRLIGGLITYRKSRPD